MIPPNIRVLFSQLSFNAPPARNVIILSPSTDNWNDFGRKLFFDAVLNVDGHETYEVTLRLAFIGGKSPTNVLSDVGSRTSGLISTSQLPQFYTLLQSIEDYRKIVSHFGLGASKLLLLINDLVAHGMGEAPEWIAQAKQEEDFIFGIVRTSDAYFALKNAADVLNGLPMESSEGLSQRIDVRVRLPGFVDDHDVTFRFESDTLLPRRVSVLIGVNGVGKTQLLLKIAEDLMSGCKSVRDPQNPDERPSISRVIVIDTPRGDRSIFPQAAPQGSSISYRLASLGGKAGEEGFGDDLVRIARSKSFVSGRSRISIFLACAKDIGPLDEIGVVTNAGEFRSIDELLSQHHFGEANKLTLYGLVKPSSDIFWRKSEKLAPLSSGQWALLRLALHVSLEVERGSLILIDEPETNLHPAFIRSFMQFLHRILEVTGSGAIIATHSAYVVREVAKEEVKVLRVTAEGAPEVNQPTLRTLGADVGALSYFVFDDEATSMLIEHVKATLPEDVDERSAAIRKIQKHLAPEAMAELRRE